MGMESFYVKIFISDRNCIGVKHSRKTLKKMLRLGGFKINPLKEKFSNLDMLANKKIELRFSGHSGSLEITMVGCFSCFFASCSTIEMLIKFFKQYYLTSKIIILDEEIGISEENIVDKIVAKYNNKYQWFKANLTDKEFVVPPSKFYKRLKGLRYEKWH